MLQAMGWQRDRYNLETEQHQGLFITDCLCSATQLCLTLCNSMDCSPPDTSVHGIFQARILEQVAISYSRGKELFGSTIFSKSVKSVKVLVTQSCPPPQRGSSVHGILQARVLEWSPFPSPGNLPAPGIEPVSPALQADSLPNEVSGKHLNILNVNNQLILKEINPEYSLDELVLKLKL